MKYPGPSGSNAGPASAHLDAHPVSVAAADAVVIPDAHLLFSGDYQRSGADLIVSDHLHRVVVPNYFHSDKRPTLVSPGGAPFDPKVIEALTGHVQYAQAGPAATAAKVAGHVVKMTGSASIIRNGVTITLNNGDVVYQNDVVQTGSGSTLGLVMIDGTTFNLTANARLMINDLTYDPASTSNTALFTLVQGAANFVAGQVAKTGDMKVGTPVATMGIRGTSVILDISSVDGKVSISVVDQRDNQVHAVEVFDRAGNLIGRVTSNGSSLTLTPTATFEVIASYTNKTVLQVQQEFSAFQSLLSTYDIGKQLVPSTPAPTDGRRGDATPQTTTKFAGTTISPVDSTATKFNDPVGSIAKSGGVVAAEQTTKVELTNADAAGIARGVGTTTEVVVVKVAVPVDPVPFVVTPSEISRVSSGPGDHFGPVMSADGRYVTYDPDGAIYLYDRQSNTTRTIAAPGDGFSYGAPTISSDGRTVVYMGTRDGHSAIFIYNNDPASPNYQHTTQLMSGGAPVAGGVPAVSGDGSTIVIELGGSIGIYDQQGHVLATITAAAVGESGTLWRPAISADGHVIAFWNSGSATPGGSGDLLVYDLSTASFSTVAHTAKGAGESAASFSGDGNRVVYQSETPDGHSEIFLYDLTSKKVVFHTDNAGGSYNPVISPDGHFIIFASDAKLTSDDTNAVADTYVVDVSDLAHPVYKLVSVAGGTSGNAASNLGAAISAGGLFVAFGSNASNFSTEDTNGGGDIFVVDGNSGHSALIEETANSPSVLTASGKIQLTGAHNATTLTVSDSTGRFTAAFDANGDINWNFREQKSDFAQLAPGQTASQRFVITLSNESGTTTTPVTVLVYNADHPVLTPADAAPVAKPVTLAQGREDTAYTITSADLIAKGVTDIDGPSLTITAVTIKSGGGTLVDNHNGTWSYTPAADYTGAVTFDYTASDGKLSASSTASLNLAAVNDSPTVTPLSGSTTEDGGIHTVDLLDGAHDVDNDPLSVANFVGTAHDQNNQPVDVSAAIAAGAIVVGAHTVAVDPHYFDHLGSGQSVTLVGNYDVSDGHALTHNTATLIINGVNDAPTATPLSASTTEDDGIQSFNLLSGAHDVDTSDTLGVTNFVGTAHDQNNQPVDISGAFNAGAIVVSGNSVTVDPHYFDYLGAGQSVTLVGNYDVSDGHALTHNTATLIINGVNDAPVAATSGNKASGNEDTTITGSVPTGSDVDNPTGLTYALVNGPSPAQGALTFHPDGSFSFAPATNFNGDVAFSYRVVDPQGAQSGPQDFTITVNPVNDAPVAATAGNKASGNEDTTITGSVPTGSDVDNPTGLTYALVNGPGAAQGVLAFNKDGTFSFAPAANFNGDVSFSYRVLDPQGAPSDPQDFTITVDPVNDAPVVSAQAGDSAGTATPLHETNSGLAISGTLTVTDPDRTDPVTVSGWDVTHTGPVGGLTDGDLMGFFSVPVNPVLTASQTAAHFTWQFNSGSEDFDFLGAGETLSLHYTIRPDDGHPQTGTGDGTVTINITGSNDAPMVTVVPAQPAGVTEDGTLASAVTVSKRDPDASDVAHYDMTGWTPTALSNDPAFGGHFYRYVPSAGISWTSARAQASAMGGHLANITSAAENAFIQNSVKPHVAAWIGASDAGQEGTWTWADGPEAGQTFWLGDGNGTAVGYANWWGVEPNGGTSENYGFIDHNGVWTDVPVTNVAPQGFIVEFDDFASFTSYSLANAYGNAVFDTTTGELTFNLDNGSAAVQSLGASDHRDVDVNIVVKDNSGAATTATATFGIDGVNDAPTIGAATLAAVAEDTANPAGKTVATLFAGKFHDVDNGSSFQGVAVVGNNATLAEGRWQYQTPQSGIWEDVGAVDAEHALIFSTATMLRFVPAPDFSGTPGGLEVLGVDDTYDDAFTVGAVQRYTEDTTDRGGSTPFSAAAATLDTSVTPVDDKPVVAITTPGNHVLSSTNGFDQGRTADQTLQLTNLGISGDSDVTVEFWADFGSSVAQMPVGFYLYDLEFADFGGATGRAIGFNTGNGDLFGVARGDLVGQWHHYAAVFHNGDATQSKLYIDGQLQTLTQIAGAPFNPSAAITDSPRIGGWDWDSLYSLDGKIDDVRIWHGARSASDIAADTAAVVNGPRQGLVAAYSFENVAAGPGGVSDVTGNGHGGTLNGLTTANVILDTTLARGEVGEDGVLVFSNANHNAISVSDVDDADLAVSLMVSHGAVTLASLTGLTVTGGANGTAALTVHGTASAINAALEGLSYQPLSSYNGFDTLTITASDGLLSDAKTVNLVVDPVNDDPVAHADSLSTNEDTPLTFGVLANDTDPDGDPLAPALILRPSHGTLALNANRTFTYTPDANFNGIDAFTYAASDRVTTGNLIVNPGAELGPASPDFGTVTTPQGWTQTLGNFTAVNYIPGGADPANSPAITGGHAYFFGGPASAVSQAHQLIDVSSFAADIDSGVELANLSGYFGGFAGQGDNMTLTARFLDGDGAELGSTTVGGVSAADRGGLSDLLYRAGHAPVPVGTRAIDVVMTATRTDGSDNDGYADNVSLTLSHGGSQSAPVAVTIDIEAINDAPVNHVPSAQSVNEDTDLVITGLSVADVDAGSAQITTTLSVDHGGVSVATINGGASVANSGQSTVTLTGTLAQINATFATSNGVVYHGNHDYNGPDTLTITTADHGNSGSGGPLTDTDTVAITLNAVNDAPVIAGANPVGAPVQEDVTTSVSGQFTSSDPDGGTPVWSVVGGNSPHPADYAFKALEFKLGGSGNTASFDDTFTVAPQNDPAHYFIPVGSFATTSGGLLLDDEHGGSFTGDVSGDAFVGQYATRTQNLNKADAFTLEGRFSLVIPADVRNGYGIVLTDSHGGGGNGNDALELMVQRGENGAVRVRLRDIDFSNNTDTTLDTSGLTGSYLADDQIVLRAVHTADSSALTFSYDLLHANGTQFGSGQLGSGTLFNGEDTTRAELFSYALATAESYRTDLYGALSIDQAGGWTYSLRNGTSPVQSLAGGQQVPESFTVQVSDGHGGIDTRTINVTIAGNNDAPVNTVPGSKTVNEDTTLAISGVSVSDIDTTSLTTTLHVTNGVLNVAASGATVSGGNTATVTLSGTSAQVNTALAGLTYKGASNYSGPDSLSVQTSDGTLSDIDNVAITITAVNDAPAGTDATVTTAEDTSYTFTTSDFGLTDPNDSPANSLLAVKITTVPAAGTLKDNGAPVTAGQFVPLSDLVAGQLRFTPAANASGNSYTSFTFQVQDNGGTANGGVNLDPTPNTITVNVTPVNDAPVLNFNPGYLKYHTGDTAVGPVSTWNIGSGSTDGVTLEGWVNWDGSTTGNQIPFYNGSGSTAGFGPIGEFLAPGLMEISILSGGVTVQQTGVSIAANEWHHIALTRLSGTIKLYLDGVLAATSNQGVNPITTADDGINPNRVDSTYIGPSGSIAEVRVWNVARSGAEIAASMSSTLTGDETGLVGYWPLNDGSGTIALDRGHATDTHVAGTQQNLTVTGATWGAGGAGWPVTGVATNEDTAIALRGLSISDVDANGGTEQVTLAVGHGTLALGNATGVSVTQDGSLGTLRFTGSVAAINAALATGLNVTPTQNYGGGDTLSFTVDDQGNSGNGGAQSSTRQVAIAVAPVNDAPAGANATVTTAEDSVYTFTTTDFGFSDPNDSPANSLLAVKITTVPAAGSLTDNGATVTAGQFVQLSHIVAGQLKFTPALNANGNAYASFTFQVQDNGGTAKGGVDLDPTPNTITVNVTAVNDAPLRNTNAVVLTANEDTNPAVSVATLFAGKFSDVDAGSSLKGIAITSNSANPVSVGIWQYSTDNGVNWLDFGTVSASSALLLSAATLLRFSPAMDVNGLVQSSSALAVDDSYSGQFTSGTSRVTLDLSGANATGGATAFSNPGVALQAQLAAVDDAPRFSSLGPAAANTENQASLLDSDTNASVVDPELSPLLSGGGDWNGTTLTLFRHGGASADDFFGIDPTAGTNVTNFFTVNGNQLQSGGQTFATFSNANGVLTISFGAHPALSYNNVLNTVISHITYTNLSDNPSPGVTIDYAFNDNNINNAQGSGGVQIGSGSVTVNITPVNDAPAANADTISSTPSGWVLNADNGHSYRLVDHVPNFAGATWAEANAQANADGAYLATITSAAEQAFVSNLVGARLAWIGGSDDASQGASEGAWKWVVGPEAGTQFWTGGSNGSPVPGRFADWESGEPSASTGENYLMFQGNRSGFWNDAGNGNQVAFVEEKGAPGAVFATFTEDTPTTITATTLLANDTDRDSLNLSITAVAPTSAHGGTVSLANNLISYTPAANFNGADSFSYTVSDGSLTSSATVSFNVASANDAPTTDINFFQMQASDEDSTPSQATVAQLFGSHFHDADSGSHLAGLAVSLSSGPTDSIVGSFQYSVDSGATWHSVGPFGQSNTYLVLDANALLRFVPAMDFNGGASISVAVVDDSYSGGFTTNSAEVKVVQPLLGGTTPFSDLHGLGATVNAVDDAPRFSNLGPAAANTEQQFSLLDGDLNASVYDPEIVHPSQGFENWAGTTLTVQRHGGAMAEDSFGIAAGVNGFFTVSGNQLMSGGQTIGSFTNSGGVLTINFGPASLNGNQVDKIVQQISYKNLSDNPSSSVTIDYAFSDNNTTGAQGSGGVKTGTASVTINITPVNDAPAGVNDSYSTNQDTALTVMAPGVLANDTDVDTPSQTLTAALVSGPGHGTLTLNRDGSFLYTPDLHYSGPDSFTYRPSDAISGNLIMNPDAESGTSVDDAGFGPVPLAWTSVTGNFTEVSYTASGGFLMENVGPAINGGHAFFSGGPDSAVSQIKQTIDVRNYAAAINAGHETANLSGYIGGLSNQNDNIKVTVHFMDAAAQELGTLTIDPDGRPLGTSLVYLAGSTLVPAGTSSMDVVVTSTRANGAYNDGYADNLSLTLTDTAAPQGTPATVNITVNQPNDAPTLANPGTVVLGDQVLVSDSADVSYWPVYSADGRKLVYLAGPADNVGDQRIAVLDILTSTTTMIDAGDVFNFDGTNAPVVTANGHFVAFRTDDPAVTGFSGQHAGDYAIMIADTATGARTLVSTNAAGQPLDDPFAPAFSPDGSHVAFWAGASTGVGYDIFVRSLTDANDITEIPIHNAFRGEIGPLFSPDGSKLAFASKPSAFSDGSDVKLIDLHNIGAGPTPLLTDAAGGQAGAFTGLGAFSADGSKLAFWSNVDLLSAGTNGHFEIYIEDLATGNLTLASTNAAGAPSNGTVTDGAVFSPDGTRIAFYSDATNLVAGDTNGQADVFVKDLITGQITLVSGTADGQFTDSYNYDPFFSPDGTTIAFDKGDPSNSDNVFTKSFGTSTDIEIGQGAQPVLIAPYLSVSDTDGTSLVSAVIAITQDLHNDQDVLAVNEALAAAFGITVNFDASGGTLTLTGSGSLAHYQSLLRTVTYFNSSDTPSGDVRGISIEVNDGAALNYQSNTATVLVDVNLTPTVDAHAPNSAPVYTFGDPSISIAPDLTLSDDDNSILGATVSFASFDQNDLLQFNQLNPYGITGAYHPATGTLTLRGTATADAYQEVLRTTVFSHGPESVDSSRTVSFRVEDNVHNVSDASDTTIVLNHAPVAHADNVIASADAFVDPSLLAGGTGITHVSLYIDPALLLANDSDPDSANLSGSAPDFDSSAQNGSHGNFYSVRGSPVYEYTDSAAFPATSGQSFTDTFNFNVSDGLRTVTSTVALKVLEYDGENDTLLGTQSSDIIIGADSAPDQIDGRAGDDILAGGFSSAHVNDDTFIFTPGMGHDKIADFQLSFDKIRLDGFDSAPGSSTAFQAFLHDQSEANLDAWKTADFTEKNSSTVTVALDTGDELTIVGVNVPGSSTLLANLHASDFLIPGTFI